MRATHWTTSRVFQIFLLLAGLLLSFWMITTLRLHSDQGQILEKVQRLINDGVWTHYGNRGTGTGNIPGSFLTAMAAGPMALWYSPYAAMTLIILTQLLCALLFFFPVRKIFSPLAGTLFLVLFWLSPWRNEQVELYNPAYLFLFSGLHFFSAYKLKEKRSFFYSALHVLALGFCGQVHFSVLILIIASLLLWIFKMVKVNWWGVLVGGALVFLSLVPYFISLTSPEAHGVTVDASGGFIPGKNLVLVYPVVKAVLYWIRYGSVYFARHIFTTVHFDWIGIEWLRQTVSMAFHVLKWPLGIATLLVSLVFQWKFFKQTWADQPLKRLKDRRSLPEKTWIFHYCFYLFSGMLIAAALSPVEFNHWHLILCLPASALLVSVGLAKWLELHPKHQWLIGALVVYFCVYNSFAALGSKMHNASNSYHDQVLKAYPKK